MRRTTAEAARAYADMLADDPFVWHGRRQPAVEAQSLFFLTVANGVEVFDATVEETGGPKYNSDHGPARFRVTALFRRGSSWEERVS